MIDQNCYGLVKVERDVDQLERPVDPSIEIDKWFPHWYREMNRDWITDRDEQVQWPINSRNDMHEGPPHIG
ncbi:uncharacterized protein N7503_011615 [Penicillium pulvis]|uniref:uncharacterized protein n=1 Tax=Penicillium pulvis TaxID=1562058 RepID=UPI002546BD2D|nr:uncharacterized protein N7503_011615 [Penicillium pulvis]KAJ5786403.1 hypothetical protein N7503_011615 [Penicillium pulvis]